ncbi:6-phosphofructokinase [Candidatus Contendibacter odensensis]|uniref:Pyrophosphate--fructose 6-phosphate 1-phosphotransferase n=1 Tax=Candidatus Contendobacter odensis Run_B_J11 TaxID=1400861 RepID=A0A7U7G7Z5_9GAMM|nr:6-phosphofructokinase [Candidatus Contendobacter odensis]MBK8752856.1 6-phosphofructokinase [Candidatus Competibacteraceae bacterium]CDH43259.1 6-phosphofructokinase [Candidatus Contendobacter odensis Run_B_J11]
MSRLTGKVVIAQGGGPTAVINQSLVGAVLEARRFPEVTAVWGARHGVRGIVDERLVNLSEATTHNLERVARTSSSALGSTRDKPDAEYCNRIFNVFKKHDVRYFFYIGGNDSSDTVRIVSEHANREGYALRAIHIPKTIDNDLPITDHCPGYPSAARFVASAIGGINADLSALPGIYIAVIMGRHAGWLTAAAGLARRHDDDGPHLIYVPERQFSIDRYLGDIDQVFKQHGRCIVALSEGVWATRNGQGKEIPVAVDLMRKAGREPQTDAHGNIQLSGGVLADELADVVQKQLGIKRVRADTFGYLQRSFPGAVSSVDAREAREVGEKAVHYACGQNRNGSVVIKRTGDYAVQYELANLADIAAKTRRLPDEFINADGNNVTNAFRNYLRPLLGDDMPCLERLWAPAAKLE